MNAFVVFWVDATYLIGVAYLVNRTTAPCLSQIQLIALREAGQPVHAGYRRMFNSTVLQSLSTDNQKLAPSLSDRYRPRTFLPRFSASTVDGLVLVTTHPPGLYSEWRPARRRINLPPAALLPPL